MGVAYIPHGIWVPTHDVICVGDGACGVEGNGRRRKEREWGKKKEKIDEEE
jgi:hypothetical protein